MSAHHTTASTTTTTYAIAGMTCAHCERSVRAAAESVDGVQSARADRVAGTLVVAGAASGDAIAAAVHEAGYEVDR